MRTRAGPSTCRHTESKVSKPRNMPYPSEGLTFQGGEGAVVVARSASGGILIGGQNFL